MLFRSAQPVAGNSAGVRRGAGRVKRPLVPLRRLCPLLLFCGDIAQPVAGNRAGGGRGAGHIERLPIPLRRLCPLLLFFGDIPQLEAGSRTGCGRGAGRVKRPPIPPRRLCPLLLAFGGNGAIERQQQRFVCVITAPFRSGQPGFEPWQKIIVQDTLIAS